MDRIAQASSTAKVMERIVISERLLFLQMFLYARVRYMVLKCWGVGVLKLAVCRMVFSRDVHVYPNVPINGLHA